MSRTIRNQYFTRGGRRDLLIGRYDLLAPRVGSVSRIDLLGARAQIFEQFER